MAGETISPQPGHPQADTTWGYVNTTMAEAQLYPLPEAGAADTRPTSGQIWPRGLPQQ